MIIYLNKKAQIRILLFNKAFIMILVKYFNYNNIFLVENIIKLLKYTIINDYTIKLKKINYLLFESIYSLKSIKLEMLKTYIKINLTNSFI